MFLLVQRRQDVTQEVPLLRAESPDLLKSLGMILDRKGTSEVEVRGRKEEARKAGHLQ